jgi:hypothetical protein
MPVLYTSRRSFRTHCVLVTRIYAYIQVNCVGARL